MSYIYRVLRDSPVGLWSFDNATNTNAPDSSGYGRTASFYGTVKQNRPIVARGIASQRMDPNSGFTVNTPILMAVGREAKPFTLEAWVKKENDAGAFYFVRNNFGIRILGKELRFNLPLPNSGTLDAVWNGIVTGEVYHIVAVYDTTALYLYVNGVRVAAAEVPEGGLDFSALTNASFSIACGSSAITTVDSCAIYNYALSLEQVAVHYALGSSYPDVRASATLNHSNTYTFHDAVVTVKARTDFEKDTDWTRGAITGNLAVVGNSLVQTYDDITGQFLAGTFLTSISLDPDIGVLEGSRIAWSSQDTLTVEVSTNGGTSWTAATNGGGPIGSWNLQARLDALIRVTFPAGSTQKTLDRLSLVLYSSKQVRGSDIDLPITINNPVPVYLAHKNYNPSNFTDFGLSFTGNTSAISIPADPEFGAYSATEFTFRYDTGPVGGVLYADALGSLTYAGSGQYIATGLAAVYLDGVAQNMANPIPILGGCWHHLVIVPSGNPGAIFIGNNSGLTAGYPFKVGYVATYYRTISANDATALYNLWTGNVTVRHKDASIVNVKERNFTDSGIAFRGYALDWSISGGG